MDTLGSRLRKARDNKRLKQTDVAKMLEVEGGTISGYERNYRDPDTTTLARLAKIYGVSTDFLTTGKEKEESTIEETNRKKENEHYADLIANIADPVKKEQAIAFLKFLANSPTDGANK